MKYILYKSSIGVDGGTILTGTWRGSLLHELNFLVLLTVKNI